MLTPNDPGMPPPGVIVLARTVKGKGAREVEDQPGKHGKPLEDAQAAVEELGGMRELSVRPAAPANGAVPHRFPAPGGQLPRYEVGDAVPTRKAYGEALKGGAAVWRAGANVLTRLRTEVPLVFDGKVVPPGEYTVYAGGPTERTSVPILLSAGDLKRVVLAPRKPMLLDPQRRLAGAGRVAGVGRLGQRIQRAGHLADQELGRAAPPGSLPGRGHGLGP